MLSVGSSAVSSEMLLTKLPSSCYQQLLALQFGSQPHHGPVILTEVGAVDKADTVSM